MAVLEDGIRLGPRLRRLAQLQRGLVREADRPAAAEERPAVGGGGDRQLERALGIVGGGRRVDALVRAQQRQRRGREARLDDRLLVGEEDEVDKVVGDLRDDLVKTNADKSEQAKEIKRLQAVAEDLQAELDEVGSPTYSGLGTKLENTLRVAEEQSPRLISQADIDAEKLRASVLAEIA